MPNPRPTQKTSRTKPSNPISISGEKVIDKTQRSDDVTPPRTPPEKEPRPKGRAVDQRKQFSGTDQHAQD